MAALTVGANVAAAAAAASAAEASPSGAVVGDAKAAMERAEEEARLVMQQLDELDFLPAPTQTVVANSAESVCIDT